MMLYVVIQYTSRVDYMFVSTAPFNETDRAPALIIAGSDGSEYYIHGNFIYLKKEINTTEEALLEEIYEEYLLELEKELVIIEIV
ncbi:hypothetical protein [Alteribacter natronophilus]|uniref:hypothetical protein n=1 Tax=Alteribacter natronophilus TaxID=2583810 RepID=UPI00110D9365|nr:hypothetical protein [Alteribacter natronophilus]TMW70391.1 hypothetical protein FGB90_17125 [Alteribacter natronophilus]